MRDFQDYTNGRRDARLRWWPWSLPVVLVGLILGIVVVAGPVPANSLRWNAGTRLPQMIKKAMDQSVQTDLSLDEAISLGRVLIRQGRHAAMTSEQLKGTPKTLPNGNEVLIPGEDANRPILDQFRY